MFQIFNLFYDFWYLSTTIDCNSTYCPGFFIYRMEDISDKWITWKSPRNRERFIFKRNIAVYKKFIVMIRLDWKWFYDMFIRSDWILYAFIDFVYRMAYITWMVYNFKDVMISCLLTFLVILQDLGHVMMKQREYQRL